MAKAAGNCYSSFLSVTAPILDSTSPDDETRMIGRTGERTGEP
jgi:hypothetical protein